MPVTDKAIGDDNVDHLVSVQGRRRAIYLVKGKFEYGAAGFCISVKPSRDSIVDFIHIAAWPLSGVEWCENLSIVEISGGNIRDCHFNPVRDHLDVFDAHRTAIYIEDGQFHFVWIVNKELISRLIPANFRQCVAKCKFGLLALQYQLLGKVENRNGADACSDPAACCADPSTNINSRACRDICINCASDGAVDNGGRDQQYCTLNFTTRHSHVGDCIAGNRNLHARLAA